MTKEQILLEAVRNIAYSKQKDASETARKALVDYYEANNQKCDKQLEIDFKPGSSHCNVNEAQPLPQFTDAQKAMNTVTLFLFVIGVSLIIWGIVTVDEGLTMLN